MLNRHLNTVSRCVIGLLVRIDYNITKDSLQRFFDMTARHQYSVTSHSEAQQIPLAGLGDTPLHSLMHLFSIQFSLWSWCLALSQGCFWSLLQSPSRSTHLFYLIFWNIFFIYLCHYFQTHSRVAAQEALLSCCCVETCICFHICIWSIISHLNITPHVMALCSDRHRKRDGGDRG